MSRNVKRLESAIADAKREGLVGAGKTLMPLHSKFIPLSLGR